MLNYLILINIILFVLCIAFIYKWYTQRRYNKQLFVRAWQLELLLIDIYGDSATDIKKQIAHTLDNITPL
jgi:hypothetical protein